MENGKPNVSHRYTRLKDIRAQSTCKSNAVGKITDRNFFCFSADKPDARPANPPSAPTAAPKPTPSASSTPPSKQDAPGGSTKETASLEGSGGKGVQSGVQSGSAVGGASKIDPRSMFVPYNGESEAVTTYVMCHFFCP
jgi:hypothetical protein